jgi:hypothetical protein
MTLVFREVQIKTTKRCHFTRTRMAIITLTSVDSEEIITLFIASDNVKWYHHLRKGFVSSLMSPWVLCHVPMH